MPDASEPPMWWSSSWAVKTDTGWPSAAQTLLKFTPAAMTRTVTSNAPGAGTSISSSWNASRGSPSRSSRMTHAAIIAGSSPGSVSTCVTSTVAMRVEASEGIVRGGSYRGLPRRAEAPAGCGELPGGRFAGAGPGEGSGPAALRGPMRVRARRRVRTTPGHIPSASRPTLGCPMEAATPLRQARVRTLGDRVVADGLVIDDECAVRLVREREEAGDDPVKPVLDAIEIGARVLDRESAGANADFVRSELEKATRDAEHALGERTREFNELLAKKVDEAFGAESGHVTKVLQRHFSDDSSTAVQNRVRQVVSEALAQVQQSLVTQFSSADSNNPLAEFKQGVVRSVHQAAAQQGETLRALDARMAT